MAKLSNPEGLQISPDDPLAEAHAAVSVWVEEAASSLDEFGYYQDVDLKTLSSGRALLDGKPEQARGCVLAAMEQVGHWDRVIGEILSRATEHQRMHVQSIPGWGYACGRRRQAQAVMNSLMRRALPFEKQDLIVILRRCDESEGQALYWMPLGHITKALERYASENVLAPELREVMERFAARLKKAYNKEAKRFGTVVQGLIGDVPGVTLEPGEVWADAANDEIALLEPGPRSRWAELLKHALSATSARPSAKWLKEAGKLVEEVGGDVVRDSLLRWFPLVPKGRSIPMVAAYQGDPRALGDVMNEENATCLRGLLWLIQALPGRDALTRAITSVTLSAYKKVPGIGPRGVKVGNAAVFALSELGTKEAVGQLAMLKVRVRFGTAQKEIEKAFNASAEALGLPRDQIEELGVPTYGLEEVGLLRESLGESRVEIVVTGSDAALHWFDPKGKALKSVPAKVKADHKEELKELQQSLKDIQAMLPAQRDRIDAMFLLQKAWPIADWRERYLDHPLVGTIARRLIWCVDGSPALFLDGQPTDALGQPVAHAEAAEITPWHPVGRTIDEITAWRRRLEDLKITQPFKQAHREVYLLTDAERNTRTYSNRFAAHVLRQHQFNALCAARGWKNKLRLMVDDELPPASRELPSWGLRAEFWIEGIGDNYGTDTNEAGVYLRLATDQVRFYRNGAARNSAHAGGGGYSSNARGPGTDDINEPLPLEEIPPLVLSEIMRDVDLFVGVGSVGNDPNWQDGGPEGRFRTYWNHYSFGELSGTAATRKQVLERLIPRLKIAGRCSFSDRFLVVRGEKRTYKIHLGSGNILMEPNDQYLCIVPDSRARAKPDDLFLPFEGDNLLSIILSKALLLADDTKITDPTITSQIARP